ncbi:MAG: indolepyruvate ferredoxin oxidoreductase family protein, partial [Alphaproteobacteria bacterium]|nr:indolepyruvate ferredoxin oxidoreductase family protein [Alphaproteobacteria bacterium]
FISGYRGSPLGSVDLELWRARKFIEKNEIHFNPGLNEDLAATSIWGTQQVGLAGDAKYDGVFAMWYGKGPGVDRSGDAFKHANNAGTAKHGGVLVLAGDDHTAKSSTAAHQSEFAFMDASIPVLNPAGVQDYLDLGLYGWAMSRYSGCWVGFKAISDTVESSASVDIGLDRIEILAPTDFEMPAGGLNIRWPDAVLAQEARLHDFKLDAVRAFARANRLDRVIFGGPKRRFGIVTTGKSYLDVRQALHDMGIDEKTALNIGICLYKVGMSWPLEPQGLRAFAEGLEELLVVEEKRGFIEDQIKAQLFNIPADRRPLVIGKQDETGRTILPSAGELTPGRITRVIADRIARWHKSERIAERLAFLDSVDAARAGRKASVERIPYFCSGCP